MLFVYNPDLTGNERKYLIDAFDSTWISSKGPYLRRFEQAFADFTDLPHVAAVSNGTVALHLALHCLDLHPGDEVIVPTFTYIASVNTIVQAGGIPIFADSREEDWLIDPGSAERLITPKTRAIMLVHLFGAVCAIDEFAALAKKHNIVIVEDCAEALGSTYKGRHVGGFGAVSTFSFFGNKTITTGEGGMVATREEALLRRMTVVKGQGMDPSRRYWHSELGFNYRMTNLAAAIGTAQLERVNSILARKHEIGQMYRERLARTGVTFQRIPAHVVSSDWLVSFLLPRGVDRDNIMAQLEAVGVETRPVFYCAHQMPHHWREKLRLPFAEDISARGMSVPSYPGMSDDDVEFVCDAIASAVGY